MTHILNTYEISNTKELKIFQDDNAESPRTFCDPLGSMVCFHGRYNLGDEHDFDSPEEFRECINEKDIAVILPLYLYDHSGITMSTTPFSCSWDSGQVGWIYVTKETVRKEFGVKRISKKLIKRLTKYLTGEVEVFDQYLTGEVYGFQLVKKTTCGSCMDTLEEVVDSCWGFYGSDLTKNGILDHLQDDDKQIVKAQL